MAVVEEEAEMEIGELFFQFFQKGVAHQNQKFSDFRIAGGGVDFSAGSHAAFEGLGKGVAVGGTDTDADFFIFGPFVLFEHVADVVLKNGKYARVGGFDLRTAPGVSAIQIFHEGVHIGIFFELLAVDAGDVGEDVTADHYQRMTESGDLHFVAQFPEMVVDTAVFVVNFPVLGVEGAADGEIRLA